MAHRVGLQNTQGNTVFIVRPTKIRLTDTGDILDLYIGKPTHRGDLVVRPGDYVGQSRHLNDEWLVRNPDKWERVS